jgi:hypothetical protein
MKNLSRTVAAVVCLFAAGCILSGTFVTEIEFVDVSTDFTNGVVSESVDLSDYTDHASDIDRIERIDLEAIVQNDLSVADTIDAYVSATDSYTTRAQVKAATDAYPVLLKYVTKPGPGSTDTLTVVEARDLLQLTGSNWESIKTLLKTGTFTAYVTSTGNTAQGTIVKANLIITFTAKL